MPLEDAAAMFADDKGSAQALERYRNAAWYQSPYVVVLDDGVAGDTSKPRRLAVVWYDVQFAKAGFALQWLPSAAMPGSGNAPISLPYPSGSAANVSVPSGFPLSVEQCDGVRVRVGVGSRPRRCV